MSAFVESSRSTREIIWYYLSDDVLKVTANFCRQDQRHEFR